MKHAKELARENRVEMYADWIAHDVDGITFNLPPAEPASINELRNARAVIRGALRTIDQAIENCEREGLRRELASTQEHA